MNQWQRIRQKTKTSKYRSGLEASIAKQLDNRGVPYRYEDLVLDYIKPAKEHKYTPDFILSNGIIIECKGRFLTADRQKMILVKGRHPNADIRFVFSNAQSRISKKSKTTYAMWCDKHKFQWADKFIPNEWLRETSNGRDRK